MNSGTKARRHEATEGAGILPLRAFLPQCLRASRRSGFTLLEMLTTVAVLIILLGLMVDLAGYVRNRSASDLSRQVLAGLDAAMEEYHTKYSDYAAIHAFTNDPQLREREESLLGSARQDNREFVAALAGAGLLKKPPFVGLPGSIFDGSNLNDAWDTPIVFMQTSHSKVGMAPSGKGFFFSAGPDRKYKTREDNLYSYEVSR